jgi:hypothetical protein
MADRQTTPGAHRRGVAPRDDDGVARQVARRQSAEALHRAGRHAAAERLLLEVAGALLRRGAPGPAAESLVALGRLRVERGRIAAAEALWRRRWASTSPARSWRRNRSGGTDTWATFRRK